jgi:hypothetical protein
MSLRRGPDRGAKVDFSCALIIQMVSSPLSFAGFKSAWALDNAGCEYGPACSLFDNSRKTKCQQMCHRCVR